MTKTQIKALIDLVVALLKKLLDILLPSMPKEK